MVMNRLTVTSNRYFDSVTLLAMSSKVRDIPGVSDASVVMATPANLAQCVATGLAVPEHAAPNDLLVTVAGEADACDAALRLVDEMISSRAAPRLRSPSHPHAADEDLDAYRSLTQAVRHEGAAQLALISVPGPYAAAEAAKALALGLHTMIFSDNVTVEDEVALKIYGGKHGLLVMGPDCGTAIVNGAAGREGRGF